MDVAKSCLTFWLVREIFYLFFHRFFFLIFSFFFSGGTLLVNVSMTITDLVKIPDQARMVSWSTNYHVFRLCFSEMQCSWHTFFFQLVNVGPPWDDLLSFLLLYNFACFLKSPWELLLLEPFTRGWDVCLFPPICGHFYFVLQSNTIPLKVEIVN